MRLCVIQMYLCVCTQLLLFLIVKHRTIFQKLIYDVKRGPEIEVILQIMLELVEKCFKLTTINLVQILTIIRRLAKGWYEKHRHPVKVDGT